MYVRQEEQEVVPRNAIAVPDVSQFPLHSVGSSALQPWLVSPARRSDCKVSDCASHVKRVANRSDDRVRSVCSFPFVSPSARSFVVARFLGTKRI